MTVEFLLTIFPAFEPESLFSFVHFHTTFIFQGRKSTPGLGRNFISRRCPDYHVWQFTQTNSFETWIQGKYLNNTLTILILVVAYFEPKKIKLIKEMLCNFLVRTLKCFYLNLFFFDSKKLKKPLSKVAQKYSFFFFLRFKTAHQKEFVFQNVAYIKLWRC